MSVLKLVYNIYQLKMHPLLTFGCRFPCRADNAVYPHDGRADKRRYRHDRRADSQCRCLDLNKVVWVCSFSHSGLSVDIRW